MATSSRQRRWEARNVRLTRSFNRWGAIIVPAVLIALVGYSVWAFLILLAVNHLLQPGGDGPQRKAAGLGVIVVYCVLLLPMAISYIRLLQVAATDPGYVPLPTDGHLLQNGTSIHRRRRSKSKGNTSQEKIKTSPSAYAGVLNRASVSNGRSGTPAGLENFYMRDVFQCEVDGMPRWCSTCKIWKPDRAHHSTEVNRCTYKMDHFCPWAGGMISETTFKFFIQFLMYGAAFNAFILAVTVYYTVEIAHQGLINANWIIVIALSALFFLFSLGMGYTSIFHACRNSTTTDTLIDRKRVHHFAILLPPSYVQSPPPVVTYPPHPAMAPTSSHRNQVPLPTPPPLYRTITYPRQPRFASESYAPPSQPPTTSQTPRTFAILTTPPGTNPYRLRSKLENFRSVLGYSVLDWLLPIKMSPCYTERRTVFRPSGAEHDSEKDAHGIDGRRLMYPLGPVVEDMIRQAGLQLPRAMASSNVSGSHNLRQR